jgi:proteasome accessory factor B
MGAKSERLMNLYILLRAQRRFWSKAEIRRALYADHPDNARGDEAFEKAFERDKEDLRELGVVIEVGSQDAYFEDEPGYRVTEQATSLPELRFEADEAAVLDLAARVWEHATLARDTSGALQKLAAQGIDVDRERLDVIAPRIGVQEPSFDAFWDAVQKRQAVTFDYRRGGSASAGRRRLQPWGVVRYSGRWYVVGHDLDRDDSRVFRLSRVEGRVRPTGTAGAYDVPAGTDVRALAASLDPASEPVECSLLVRDGAGVLLRRRATRVEHDRPGPDARTTWDRVVLEADPHEVEDLVLVHADRVVVESPAGLREAVVTRLRAAMSGRAGGGGT